MNEAKVTEINSGKRVYLRLDSEALSWRCKNQSTNTVQLKDITGFAKSSSRTSTILLPVPAKMPTNKRVSFAVESAGETWAFEAEWVLGLHNLVTKAKGNLLALDSIATQIAKKTERQRAIPFLQELAKGKIVWHDIVISVSARTLQQGDNIIYLGEQYFVSNLYGEIVFNKNKRLGWGKSGKVKIPLDAMNADMIMKLLHISFQVPKDIPVL